MGPGRQSGKDAAAVALMRDLETMLADDVDRDTENVELLSEARRRAEAGDEELILACAARHHDGFELVDVLRAYLPEHPDPTGARYGPMAGKRLFTGDDEGGIETKYRGRPAPMPAELPELRRLLAEAWDDRGLFVDVAAIMVQDERIDNAAAYIAWERSTLAQASLWWVSAPMVDVLMTAAQSVPPDVCGYELAPLDDYGLVVLEKPWTGLAVDADLHPERGTLAVDAFTWGPVRLPPIPGRSSDLTAAVALSSYQWSPVGASDEYEAPTERARDLNRAMMRASQNGRCWFPLGRSDWPIIDPICASPWPMSDAQLASFTEDRRVLCALMTVLAHDGIATTHLETVSRGTRRRLERAGDRSGGRYRIVTLRTLRDPGEETGNDAGEKVAHDHRWLVSGHWRRQPYGPGRTLRRLQWINPFVKGPEDAPLKVKEVIHAWRR